MRGRFTVVCLSLVATIASSQSHAQQAKTADVPTPVGQGNPSISSQGNVNVTNNARPQVETTIAVDPLNPQYLVAGTIDFRFGDHDAGIAYSSDCGANWSATTLASLNPELAQYQYQADPAVAAFRNRVFYYAFMDFEYLLALANYSRIVVAKSSDGGVTWPEYGVVVDNHLPSNNQFDDHEQIVVDNTGGQYDGNVLVSWTRFPTNWTARTADSVTRDSTRIMIARSTDGGPRFRRSPGSATLGIVVASRDPRQRSGRMEKSTWPGVRLSTTRGRRESFRPESCLTSRPMVAVPGEMI